MTSSSRSSARVEPKTKRQKKDVEPCDDLIAQFPGSAQRPRSQQGNVHHDRLQDKQDKCKDAIVPMDGYALFKYHYRKSQKNPPVSNPWHCGLAKLLVPNVFVDVELIRALAKSYVPEKKAFYGGNGLVMMHLTRSYICQVFGLNENHTVPLNIGALGKEYEDLKNDYKRKWLPLHRPMILKDTPKGVEKLLQRYSDVDKPPFELDLFEDYFKKTYYGVCQVLGEDAHLYISTSSAVLTADIQSYDNNRAFDYAGYLEKEMNKSFTTAKRDSSVIVFKWYSLLLHMFLYRGYEANMWKPPLKLTPRDKEGRLQPVQEWTCVWDSGCLEGSSYMVFQEFFVKEILLSLGKPLVRISENIMSFLRPKDSEKRITLSHNWGDWYLYDRSTVIGMYGFEGQPHILPPHVPDRLGILEAVRQLNDSDFLHFRSKGKASFMPGTLEIGDFTVTSKKGYSLILDRLKPYRLQLEKPRRFDPEGFINNAKRAQGLSGYNHVFSLPEDLIRNCSTIGHVKWRSQMYANIMKAENLRKQLDLNYQGAFIEETNEVKKVEKMLMNGFQLTSILQSRASQPQNIASSPRQSPRPMSPIAATPLHRVSPQPTPEPSFSVDDEGWDAASEVEVLQQPIVRVSSPPPQRRGLNFEPATELSDDVRELASQEFMADDNFIQTEEFKSFIYKLKGKIVNDRLNGVNEENKKEAMSLFWQEVHDEFRDLTVEKAREAVRNAGCLLLPGWDISSAIAFDNLRRNEKINIKLNQEGVDKLYSRSGFDPDSNVLAIWSLYPSRMRPLTIQDPNQIVGHLITYRQEDSSPVEAAGLVTNAAMFSEAAKKMYEENQKMKLVIQSHNEKINQLQGNFTTDPVGDIGKKLRLQLTEETTQRRNWQKEAKEATEREQKLIKEVRTIKIDLSLGLINGRFSQIMPLADAIWQKHHDMNAAFNVQRRNEVLLKCMDTNRFNGVLIINKLVGFTNYFDDNLLLQLYQCREQLRSELEQVRVFLKQHKKYHSRFVKYLKRFNKLEGSPLPSFWDTSRKERTYEDWKGKLAELPEEILVLLNSDEENLVENLGIQLHKLSILEFGMTDINNFIATFNSNEYMAHTNQINQFVHSQQLPFSTWVRLHS